MVALWILETPQLSSRGTVEIIPLAKKLTRAQLWMFRMLLLGMKDGIPVMQTMNWEIQPSVCYFLLVSRIGFSTIIDR